MLYEFKGHRPVVDPSAFVHPQAAVTGNVWIGKNVYVGPGAAIRGDWGRIIIEDGCNVQESCTIHMFPGVTVLLKEGVHLGHGAIVHGAVIGRNCLIGMNSVIMDNVEIGDECIVGALTFVKAAEKIPPRKVVAGNPAKILKEVSEEMLKWKTEGTALYQALPGEMRESWKECEAGKPEGDRQRMQEIREYVHKGVHPDPGRYRPWKNKHDEPQDGLVKEPEAEYGRRQFTIEDYLNLEKDSDFRHEYYRGEIFAMGGARPEHNRIISNLMIFLGPKVRRKSCDIFGSDQRVHIPANSLFTYPDLVIFCGQPTFYDDNMSLTNPTVLVEVLSSSTRDYDRVTKLKLYQDIPSLQEYLVIDPRPYLAEHWQKHAKKGWELQKYDQPADHFLIRTIDVKVPLEEVYRNIQAMKKV
ncbi:MAG TPA: Uma2 family endonuclease [Puia sp.]|nr:Uma2 family endonuclease [Puia sp.]